MNMSLFVEGMKRWGLKGGLGILDQGLYSGVNFLVGILLARWFSPEIYGGFSAAYSLFLLLSVAQVALIAEPMSIFGAYQYRYNITSYLNYLLRIQWITSTLGSFLLILFTFFISNDVVRDAMLGMAVALPFILYFWYLRRAFYIEMQSAMAMLMSFIYSILLLLAILLVQSLGLLTSSIAYLAMGLSSLVAALFALRRLGLRLLGKGGTEAGLNPEIVKREILGFGKWILPAYLAGWFTSLSLPFFITVLLNAQSAGAFRALQNLFLPFQQLLAAITLLMLSWLARQKSEHGSAKLFRATQAAAGITELVAGLYCLLIVIFRRDIVFFLYASEYYSSFDNLVIFLAVSTLLGSAPLILGLALRVLGQPNIILWSKGAGAIFTLVFGFPIIWMFHMNGVIFSLIGSSIVEVSLLLFLYLRVRRGAMLISNAGYVE
jgi:O-antigen/teichoic acid export membrane protein